MYSIILSILQTSVMGLGERTVIKIEGKMIPFMIYTFLPV